MFMYNNQFSGFYYPQNTYSTYYQHGPLPEASLSINLPSYEYNQQKIPIIPFDRSDGMFDSLESAMKYVGQHCVKNHGLFTRQYARLYSPFCFVLDILAGGYVSMSEVGKREFNAAYMKISQMFN